MFKDSSEMPRRHFGFSVIHSAAQCAEQNFCVLVEFSNHTNLTLTLRVEGHLSDAVLLHRDVILIQSFLATLYIFRLFPNLFQLFLHNKTGFALARPQCSPPHATLTLTAHSPLDSD